MIMRNFVGKLILLGNDVGSIMMGVLYKIRIGKMGKGFSKDSQGGNFIFVRGGERQKERGVRQNNTMTL